MSFLKTTALGVVVIVSQSTTMAQVAPICTGSDMGEFVLRQQVTSSSEFRDAFGHSVAVHNGVLVVGDDKEGETAPDGSASFFQESQGSLLEETTTLRLDNAFAESFGGAVSIWGNTLVVGAPDEEGDNMMVGVGAAYVYVRSDENSEWEVQARLIPSTPLPNMYFGSIVEIDRERIAVGVNQNRGPGSLAVYQRVGEEWAEEIVLSLNSFVDGFGLTASFFEDRLAVGAYIGGTVSSIGRGDVSMYKRTGWGLWEIEQQITHPSSFTLTSFGASVSMFKNTLVVGAPGGPNSVIAGHGVVFVYNFDEEAGWILLQELIPPNTSLAEEYGATVKAEKDLILVSDYTYTFKDLVNAGAVFVYTKVASEWNLFSTLTAPEPEADAQFGWALDMHSTLLAISSKPLTGEGSVFAYTHCVETAPTSPPTLAPTQLPSTSSAPVATASEEPSSVPSVSDAPSRVTDDSPSISPTSPRISPTIVASDTPSSTPVELSSKGGVPTLSPTTTSAASKRTGLVVLLTMGSIFGLFFV